jgi:hypothetical protein
MKEFHPLLILKTAGRGPMDRAKNVEFQEPDIDI